MRMTCSFSARIRSRLPRDHPMAAMKRCEAGHAPPVDQACTRRYIDAVNIDKISGRVDALCCVRSQWAPAAEEIVMPSAVSPPRQPGPDRPISVPPGLAGVAVTETSIGDVRGQEGFY